MKIRLLEFKQLKEFPTGSAIEFYHDHLYIISKDAKEILVLSKNWKELERISIFQQEENSIQPSQMEFDDMTLIKNNESESLLLLGSDSPPSNNNYAVVLDLNSPGVEEFGLGVFNERIKKSGIDTLKITSVIKVEDHLLLSNCGAPSIHPSHIIITSVEFWKDQENAELVILPIDLPVEKHAWTGMSGMAYSPKNDWLIFTASIEEKNDAKDPVTFGDSYIGIIENVSRKIGRKKMKINELISLPAVENKFKGFNMLSVSVQSEKEGRLKIHLVGSNEKKVNCLFKVRLKI